MAYPKQFRQVVLRENEKIIYVDTSFSADYSFIYIGYEGDEENCDVFDFAFIEDAANDHDILMDIMCK